MKLPLRVGAVLYPGFEMLDTFGPLEMYSALGKDRVEIITIAQNPGLWPPHWALTDRWPPAWWRSMALTARLRWMFCCSRVVLAPLRSWRIRR